MQRLRSREVSSRLTLSFARHQASVQTPKFQRGFALENWEVQRGGAVQSVRFYTARFSETSSAYTNISLAVQRRP